MRAGVVFVCALVVFLPPGGADGAEETAMQYLQAGIGEFDVRCETQGATGYCLGGVIFHDVTAGSYEVVIADRVTRPVAGAFTDGGGTWTEFCGSATTPPVAAGATITVAVFGPLTDSFHSPCFDFAPGVEGEVRLRAL